MINLTLKGSILTIVFGFALSPALYAHNVVSGAYADGMTIEGEIGFSSGAMADAGVVVEVLNESGDKLGETVLTEGGMFVYQVKDIQTHIFKADLSSGHVAEMTVEADELSNDEVIPVASAEAKSSSATEEVSAVSASLQGVKQETITSKPSASSPQATVAIAPTMTATELQSMIRGAVAQQVRPLQKELRAYKEKVMFRDIAGGLGFIFGLFGVAAWMASKRNLKEGNQKT